MSENQIPSSQVVEELNRMFIIIATSQYKTLFNMNLINLCLNFITLHCAISTIHINDDVYRILDDIKCSNLSDFTLCEAARTDLIAISLKLERYNCFGLIVSSTITTIVLLTFAIFTRGDIPNKTIVMILYVVMCICITIVCIFTITNYTIIEDRFSTKNLAMLTRTYAYDIELYEKGKLLYTYVSISLACGLLYFLPILRGLVKMFLSAQKENVIYFNFPRSTYQTSSPTLPSPPIFESTLPDIV